MWFGALLESEGLSAGVAVDLVGSSGLDIKVLDGIREVEFPYLDAKHESFGGVGDDFCGDGICVFDYIEWGWYACSVDGLVDTACEANYNGYNDGQGYGSAQKSAILFFFMVAKHVGGIEEVYFFN